MPDILHRRLQKNELGHVLLDELEAGIPAQVGNVIHPARDEIVDADHAVPARQQQIHQVRAQETRGTGDDRGGPGAG